MTDHKVKLTRDQRISLAGYYVLAGMFAVSGIADVIIGRPWLAVINYLTAAVFVWCAVFYRRVYISWALQQQWYRFVMNTMTARSKHDLN